MVMFMKLLILRYVTAAVAQWIRALAPQVEGLVFEPPRWRGGRALPSHAEDQGSIPGRERPTVSLPNAGQQVTITYG